MMRGDRIRGNIVARLRLTKENTKSLQRILQEYVNRDSGADLELRRFRGRIVDEGHDKMLMISIHSNNISFIPLSRKRGFEGSLSFVEIRFDRDTGQTSLLDFLEKGKKP